MSVSDWIQITSSLINVAVVSFFIPKLLTKNQKEIEFRYDYRKYILDKRKAVYDQVETLVSAYLDQSIISKFLATSITKNWIVINNLRVKIYDILNNNIWLSKELESELNELAFFLFRLKDRIDDEKFSKPHDLAVDPRVLERYITYEASIVKILFEDIVALDDIETFRSKKISQHQEELEKFK